MSSNSSIQAGPTDPPIVLTQDQVVRFWSAQAGLRGVTTDAQWATAMGQIFSAAAFPGVDPTSLTFLRQFFIQVVHVGTQVGTE
jgi:hypothetical protein